MEERESQTVPVEKIAKEPERFVKNGQVVITPDSGGHIACMEVENEIRGEIRQVKDQKEDKTNPWMDEIKLVVDPVTGLRETYNMKTVSFPRDATVRFK